MQPPVTLLRVKRKRNGWVPDAVHVQLSHRAKRPKLTNALEALSLTKPDLDAPNQTSNDSSNVANKDAFANNACVVFRRLRFDDGLRHAPDASCTNMVLDVLKNTHENVRIVDVDNDLLKDVQNGTVPVKENPVTNSTEEQQSTLNEHLPHTDCEEEQHFDVFARDCDSIGKLPFALRHTVVKDAAWDEDEDNAIAYVDGASIFAHAFLKGGSNDSEEEVEADLSDYDARSVDYPSTPAASFSSDNSNSDWGDYERYERYGDFVEYDSEC